MKNIIQVYRNSKAKWLIILISLSVYFISLTQNAVTYKDFEGIKSLPSVELLMAGSMVILGGGLLEWIIWLANPLYFASIVFFIQNNNSSKIYVNLASILSILFLFWTKILISESGSEGQILHKDLGYWLWLLSILILNIGIQFLIKPGKK